MKILKTRNKPKHNEKDNEDDMLYDENNRNNNRLNYLSSSAKVLFPILIIIIN